MTAENRFRIRPVPLVECSASVGLTCPTGEQAHITLILSDYGEGKKQRINMSPSEAKDLGTLLVKYGKGAEP